MAVKPIPDGFHTVTPYLLVKGVTQLLDFLRRAFDAKEISRSAMPDGTVMHAQVQIGDSFVMMGEAGGQWQPMPGSIYLYVPDTDATYKQALAAGASSVMEPADQFYGDRSAGVKDSSGNMWWIATHVEEVTPEEMKKREEEYMKKHGGG
jgi:uncharacterized glyoxalase superfamily protein PhnB